ncbi:MAG: 2-amino-4-hydroxy-6-hydroxymethyldihydropteridine diphosphokinase [Treponema sp.]|nr:2-amino-4-hydroxy-6-hydroxymethyldihydropteridine diphosphokinase [Treponema sp.]
MLCVLGLGSNTPCKDLSCTGIINSAVEELQKILTQVRLSPFYKTAPLYVTDQPPFINAALSGFFFGSPRNLLQQIQKVEAMYGRDRRQERRWGERTLDIDILLFGDLVITEDDLVIPHPRLNERAFALRPLLDLLPEATEPGTGKKYGEILAELASQEIELENTYYTCY